MIYALHLLSFGCLMKDEKGFGGVGGSKKVKVIPQQAEVAQGVPGRLRPRIS
jgi:hypothetical protein